MSFNKKIEKAKYDKEYRRKNPNRIAAINARYYLKNLEKIAKQHVEYYRKNKKRLLETRKKYQLEYLAKYRLTMAWRYRKLLVRHYEELVPRGIVGSPMSIQEHRNKLYFADGRERRCWYCYGENNKTGSGLDRLDNNVTYTLKNTVPCCRGCNTWRGATHSVRQTRNHFKPMRDAIRSK